MNIGIRHNFVATVRSLGDAGYELAFKLTTRSTGYVQLTHPEWTRMLMGHETTLDVGDWSFEATQVGPLTWGAFDLRFGTRSGYHQTRVTRRRLVQAAYQSDLDGEPKTL